MFEIPESARWALAQLFAFLAFMYYEAGKMRVQINTKLDESKWEKELIFLRQEYKDRVDRMEVQYEIRLTQMFDQLTGKIESTENHLSEKIDILIKLNQHN